MILNLRRTACYWLLGTDYVASLGDVQGVEHWRIIARAQLSISSTTVIHRRCRSNGCHEASLGGSSTPIPPTYTTFSQPRKLSYQFDMLIPMVGGWFRFLTVYSRPLPPVLINLIKTSISNRVKAKMRVYFRLAFTSSPTYQTKPQSHRFNV